jgi:hypothetical protein
VTRPDTRVRSGELQREMTLSGNNQWPHFFFEIPIELLPNMRPTVSSAADGRDEFLIGEEHVMTLREGCKQSPNNVRFYLPV